MNKTVQLELYQKREYLVVKSNEIVQKSRFDLSLQEQKTIAYICSMIKPRTEVETAANAPFVLEYDFNIRDYCRICGIEYDSGKNYSDIKKLLKGLRDKSFWLTLPDGSETTVSWIAKATTNKGSGKARIRLDDDMIPFLFDLKKRFFSYGLYSILSMQSQYSIRLYELIKSYSNFGSHEFKIDELKRLLMVENIATYNNFAAFDRKVLKIAQKEINAYTDLFISYQPIKSGRKVERVNFIMTMKGQRDKIFSDSQSHNKLGKIE